MPRGRAPAVNMSAVELVESKQTDNAALALPSNQQVNLALLESSGIAGAVAQLRNNRNASIALKADDIVHRWRTAAVAALTQATGKNK